MTGPEVMDRLVGLARFLVEQKAYRCVFLESGFIILTKDLEEKRQWLWLSAFDVDLSQGSIQQFFEAMGLKDWKSDDEVIFINVGMDMDLSKEGLVGVTLPQDQVYCERLVGDLTGWDKNDHSLKDNLLFLSRHGLGPMMVDKKRNVWDYMKDYKGTCLVGFICLVVYLVGLWISPMATYPTTSLIVTGGLYRPFIYANYEFFRLLTAGFVHSDFFHVACNLFALFMYGKFLEKSYGTKRYLLTLFLSVVFANACVLAADDAILTVGLSGGIYGLLGLLLVYFYENGLLGHPMVQQQILTFAFINVVANLMPNISWMGHLSGFICGVMLGFVFIRQKRFKHVKIHALLCLMVAFLGVAVLFLEKPKPKDRYLLTDRDVISVLDKLHLAKTSYGQSLVENLTRYYQEGRP